MCVLQTDLLGVVEDNPVWPKTLFQPAHISFDPAQPELFKFKFQIPDIHEISIPSGSQQGACLPLLNYSLNQCCL